MPLYSERFMPTPASFEHPVLHCADGQAIELIVSRHVSREYFDTMYLDTASTTAACQQCPNHGKSWSCPPLSKQLTEPYTRYGMVRLYVARIPVAPHTPVEDSLRLLTPAKAALLTHLRDVETQSGGRICGLAGVCELCAEKGCTRPDGLPCRYPLKVRPSLESLGYNVANAVKDLTGVEMLWGKNGCLPEYLLLAGALFFNQ